MAAGGVGFLRRKAVHTYPVEFDHPKNDLRHGVEHSKVRPFLVDASSDFGSRKNRLYHRIEEHEFGGMSNVEQSLAKRVENSTEEVVFQVPSQRKRKFSSITCEKNKDGKISSKNIGKNVFPAFQSFPDGQEVDIDSVEDALNSPVSEADNQAEPLTSKTSMLDCWNDEERETQVNVKEEADQVRNISLSRWASDSDSPRDTPDDDCMPGTRSTTGSSGSRREGSVGNSVRTSGSNEEGCYIVFGSSRNDSSDVSTVIDENQCENVSIDQVECDYGDDNDDDLYPSDKPSVSSPRSINMLEGCRSVFEYEKLNKINEGTYGVVYKAKDMKSGEIVALKKVKMDLHGFDDGFPLSSLREINILLSLSHPSIVNVKEVVMADLDSIFMAMEYMEYDLKGLMEMMNRPFSISEVKWLMLQLLEGVKYLHDNWVLHRDLKASNLLLNKDGKLKICDFGMSRQYGSPLKPFTSLVVTLWYRAPEILLGTKQYSTAVDVWSVGCIMAEMLARKPLFNGKTEVDQLDKIFRTMGTPNDTIWPGVSKLPGMKANFVKQPYNALRKQFPPTSFIAAPVLSDLGFDLLSQLLTYDPAKRITAAAALDHDWFREAPLPRSDFKPTYPALHDQNRYRSGRQHDKRLKRCKGLRCALKTDFIHFGCPL